MCIVDMEYAARICYRPRGLDGCEVPSKLHLRSLLLLLLFCTFLNFGNPHRSMQNIPHFPLKFLVFNLKALDFLGFN